MRTWSFSQRRSRLGHRAGRSARSDCRALPPWPGAFADNRACQLPEAVGERGPKAVATPPAKVVIDGLPRRKALRQESPRAGALGDIEDDVGDLTQRGAGPATAFCGRQQRSKPFSLGVGEIGLGVGDLHRLKPAAARVGRIPQRAMSSPTKISRAISHAVIQNRPASDQRLFQTGS